jgi:hypothetical protein
MRERFGASGAEQVCALGALGRGRPPPLEDLDDTLSGM